MTLGLAVRKREPRVPRQHGESGKSYLNSFEGLAALSLDALTSVAYGPQAIMLTLVAAGAGAVTATLPIILVIAGLLGILVISYSQVIAVHPDGGGSYAVAKKDLGTKVSLLAAASLVVDYVLTVAVSVSSGVASLTSAFPDLARYSLAICLVALAFIFAVNMRGIADSARTLMLPTALFVVSILGIIAAGLLRSNPAAVVGTRQAAPVTDVLGLFLLLKAFSAGCSALTGIEAIANSVPMFRKPRVKEAQRTEIMLGALLGLMLIGLAVVIRRHDVVPREGVTVLAQLTAAAYGTGWAYYACSIIVTLVLALAANTSFGGLPVLMSLLAKDDRLPHLFTLRSERPVHRYGVVTLALLSGVLLIIVDADTQRLIPLFAIGVFIGFTVSQTGLVLHWTRLRSDGWAYRALLNGFGAVLTAVTSVILLTTKFLEGAWFVVLIVPLLMLLFSRVEHYYTRVRGELRRGKKPPPPLRSPSVVLVPLGAVDAVAERAVTAAISLGDEVVALGVFSDSDKAQVMREDWDRWSPGVRLEILASPRHSLVQPVLDYVEETARDGKQVAVLIPQVEPHHRRYRILENQRGVLLAGLLSAHTDVAVCLLPYRLDL